MTADRPPTLADADRAVTAARLHLDVLNETIADKCIRPGHDALHAELIAAETALDVALFARSVAMADTYGWEVAS